MPRTQNLCPQQMLRARAEGKTFVSATMCPQQCVLDGPGARFSKAAESFRARKAIFRSSVAKNRELYTPETSCMKGTSLHL